MVDNFGDAVAALIVLLIALASLAGAGRTWLKARTRVAEAQAETADAQAKLLEAQAQRYSRVSLPPGEEEPWSAALHSLGQRVEELFGGLSNRVEHLSRQHSRLADRQIETREQLARLDGRMNGHSHKKD